MASTDPTTAAPSIAVDGKEIIKSNGSATPHEPSHASSTTQPTMATAKTETTSSMNSATPASHGPSKPKGPPPGYKLVKRRKEDGTVVTMMRKMTAEELEATGQTEPPPALKEGVQFKIVTVKNADGSFTRVKRPIKPDENPAPTPAPATKASVATESLPSTVSSTGKPVEAKKPSPQADNSANPAITPGTTVNETISRSIEGEPKRTNEILDNPTATDAAALAQQQEDFRQRRMQKYKGSMIRGLGTILGSSVSHMDFSHGDSNHENHGDVDDIQDGDIIDSDEDWSDDDLEDDDADHSPDQELDDRKDEDSSGLLSTPLNFNTGAASQALITGVATTAASAATAPQKAAPGATPPPAPNSSEKETVKDETEKVTYKVTVAELEENDRKHAEQDAERPLRRHWTNFTFYFMASLSIILPLLFLLLAMFMFIMNGKPTDSSWKVMPDVIKVGISAWPIVFAAVVAQVFKAYATWKVERGIKLIQLEQLIGSNSFGSAVKQPLVLRQLDTLSLFLLITWCLSPIGSQALQRAYTTGPDQQTANTTIYYLNQLADNKVFSSNWNASTGKAQHAADNQFVATEFLSTLLPVDQSNTSSFSSYWMDHYYHPIMYDLNYTWPVTAMGLPVLLPTTKIPGDAKSTNENAPTEYFEFNVTSSYFNFTCGDWTIQEGSDIAGSSEYQWSKSGTLGLKFTMGDAHSTSHIVFVSANINTDIAESTNATDWDYSQIECEAKQLFVDATAYCYRIAPDSNSGRSGIDTQCSFDQSTLLDEAAVLSGNYGTQIEDFSDDWAQMGASTNSNRDGKASTPTELYLTDTNFQMDYTSWTRSDVNLSQSTPPTSFAQNFGILFNTWVGIGYCPECQALTTIADLEDMTANVKNRFLPTYAYFQYSIDQVFKIVVPWAVCFVVCTVLMLVAGITSVIVESRTVAPDTLGYVSTVARNSRYLHVKPTSGAMSGPERARKLADTEVMMQDVKAKAGVGKIALGLKSDKAVKLRYDRLYR